MAIFNSDLTKNTIVIDCSDNCIKIGFAGSYLPERILQSFVLKDDNPNLSLKNSLKIPNSSFIGEEFSHQYSFHKLIENGEIIDFEIFKQLLLNVLEDYYRLSAESIEEFSFIFVDRNSQNQNYRSRTIEFFFEDLCCNSLFIKDSGCFSLFCHGKTNGFVMEFDDSFSKMTPVENGNSFRNFIFKSPYSANLMYHQSEMLLKSLDIDILSFHQKRTIRNMNNIHEICNNHQIVDDQNRRSLYEEFICENIEISPSPLDDASFNTNLMPFIHHKFSRNSPPLKLGLDRYHITECMFSPKFIKNPNLFKITQNFSPNNNTTEFDVSTDITLFPAVPSFICKNYFEISSQMNYMTSEKNYIPYNSMDCSDLINHLLCVGRFTLLKNFSTRLCFELNRVFSQFNSTNTRPNSTQMFLNPVTNPNNIQFNINRAENLHSTFIGASIIACMPEFKNLVWSKDKYKEGYTMRDALQIS